jgi:CRISPR-associated protein Cas5d
MSYGIKLKVSGDYACFTRPEMKVERVSYDVITPSAARGILEAIYWKPSIAWIIDRIHVLKQIRFTNIRRNELSNRLSSANIKKVMKDNTISLETFIEQNRQQRAATILQDVAYIIEAHFIFKGKDDNNPGKHLDTFNRRLEKGQCFHQPYLGCREFPARFSPVHGNIPESKLKDKDLGFILYDIDFNNNMQAMFFRAKMENGIIDVPAPDSKELIR